MGKHLTFASNITVAQLQNEGDFDYDKTTPDTIVSPTFKIKDSDASLLASGRFGVDQLKKITGHFVEQSES